MVSWLMKIFLFGILPAIVAAGVAWFIVARGMKKVMRKVPGNKEELADPGPRDMKHVKDHYAKQRERFGRRKGKSSKPKGTEATPSRGAKPKADRRTKKRRSVQVRASKKSKRTSRSTKADSKQPSQPFPEVPTPEK